MTGGVELTRKSLLIWVGVCEYKKRRSRVAEADSAVIAKKRLRLVATHCTSIESAMEQGLNAEDDDANEW